MLPNFFEDYVCTYPDFSDLPCFGDPDIRCDCCVYYMDPDDLPEVSQ